MLPQKPDEAWALRMPRIALTPTAGAGSVFSFGIRRAEA